VQKVHCIVLLYTGIRQEKNLREVKRRRCAEAERESERTRVGDGWRWVCHCPLPVHSAFIPLCVTSLPSSSSHCTITFASKKLHLQIITFQKWLALEIDAYFMVFFLKNSVIG